MRESNEDTFITIYTEVGLWSNEQVHKTINNALAFLQPTPFVKHALISIDRERRYVLEIQPSPEPIVTEDRHYYVRRGQRTLLLEENLIRALARAVPEVTPNILNSLKSKEDVTEISGSTRIVENNVHEKLEAIPTAKLHEFLSESIKATRDELSVQRRERLQQANIAFIVALVFLILAMLLVFTGVILIFTVDLQTGVVTSVSSIVSGFVSGLVFTFNKQANDRVDRYTEEMIALEKAHTALTFAAHITDIRIRDTVISDLAKTISSGDYVSR